MVKKGGKMTKVTVLIDKETGAPINIGDKRRCHNYDGWVTITGWDAYGKNRVYYVDEKGYNSKIEGGHYAGVVGAKIIWEDA
jgi:hypothetical protein|tara:strand:+ start:303 stop:548 length:246 start_codon:yes stop_codon:yes gene_type:complete